MVLGLKRKVIVFAKQMTSPAIPRIAYRTTGQPKAFQSLFKAYVSDRPRFSKHKGIFLRFV